MEDNTHGEAEWKPPRLGVVTYVVIAIILMSAASIFSCDERRGEVGMIANPVIQQNNTVYGGPLTLLFPEGGKTWEFGSEQEITWSGGEADWPITIYLVSEDGTQLYRTLVEDSQNDGTEPWIVDVPSRTYKIQIQACRKCSSGSSWAGMVRPFTVAPAAIGAKVIRKGYPANESLVIYSPTGGEEFAPSSQHNIQWYGGDSSWTITIMAASTDTQKQPEIIARDVPNTGLYVWAIPSYFTTGEYYLNIYCSNCTALTRGTTAYSYNTFSVEN